jgi:hypothetical protein
MNGGEAALFIAGLGSSIAWPILTRKQEFSPLVRWRSAGSPDAFASNAVDSDRCIECG